MSESSTPPRNYMRLSIRTKCDYPIQLTYERDGQNKALPARCTNLCIGGFFADLPEAVAIDQGVSVEFLPDRGAAAMRFNAVVRHVHGNEAGFQFLTRSEAEEEAVRQFFAMKAETVGS